MAVSMDISISEALRDQVQKRVAEGGFANASDFVEALIREDREREANKRLEALLLEGVQSGGTEEATDAYWNALKAEVRSAAAKPARE